MSAQTKPTIVFCHGIWADGSCFNKVIPALQADGYEVIAVQYGLDSFEEDLATVKRTLNRVGSPVLLVGHSYGGATITGSGTDERVVGLVYIAAVAPDAGETVQDQLDKYPSACNAGMTLLKQEPSAQMPWQKTIVGLVCADILHCLFLYELP